MKKMAKIAVIVLVMWASLTSTMGAQETKTFLVWSVGASNVTGKVISLEAQVFIVEDSSGKQIPISYDEKFTKILLLRCDECIKNTVVRGNG